MRALKLDRVGILPSGLTARTDLRMSVWLEQHNMLYYRSRHFAVNKVIYATKLVGQPLATSLPAHARIAPPTGARC